MRMRMGIDGIAGRKCARERDKKEQDGKRKKEEEEEK